MLCNIFFFSSRRRHTRLRRDWSSDVCSSDLLRGVGFHGRFMSGGGTVTEDRHGALGNLNQDVEFLARAGGIGHDHLAAVDHPGQKFLGDKFVDLFPILDAVAIVVAEEIGRAHV